MKHQHRDLTSVLHPSIELTAHMRLPDLIDSHYSNLTDQVETDSTVVAHI